MATLEVPLADPVGSPKQVSADYYYRIPVRPIYKEYPIYAPGHEPPGYLDWLKRQALSVPPTAPARWVIDDYFCDFPALPMERRASAQETDDCLRTVEREGHNCCH